MYLFELHAGLVQQVMRHGCIPHGSRMMSGLRVFLPEARYFEDAEHLPEATELQAIPALPKKMSALEKR